MNALQKSTVGFAVPILSTLLLQAITLSAYPGIGQHFNNPNHVALILDRIQALSDIVQELYRQINSETLENDMNDLKPSFAEPISAWKKLPSLLSPNVLMMTRIYGLYLFLDGLQSISSCVLKIYLLSSMLLFLSVEVWHMYVSGVIVAGDLEQQVVYLTREILNYS